jgi:DNA-binding response OmpR family regulator
MKVLVADDVGVIRRTMEETLRDMGHEVIGAADGAAAWMAFQQAHPPLVITDWLMPEMDGLALCRRIREDPVGEATFVLLQTGRGTSDDLFVALDAGVDDFITKPISAEHLRARVQIAERRMVIAEERRKAEASLARNQWLAGIGESALAMQHELRSPLTALMGEVELGLESSDVTELRGALAGAGQQARRMNDIIGRLVTLRHPRSTEPLPGMRMIDLSEQQEP